MDSEQRRRASREPRVDWQDVARLLAVRPEMANFCENLLATRYQTESALAALEEKDVQAAGRHLHEAQRVIEAAGGRFRLPKEVFLRRLPHSKAAKIFKGGLGEGSEASVAAD